MMATTIKQDEAAPDSYPVVAVDLSAAAWALDEEIVWERIESWVAWRWTARGVTWIAEGPGEWAPPLAPATIATTEVWTTAGAWEAAELTAAPLGGYVLPGAGPYRFSATVGGGEPPLPFAVEEAVRRLAEYMAADAGTPGATREQTSAGPITLGHSRSASWLAEAMQNSGAGDLLRPYRRA